MMTTVRFGRLPEGVKDLLPGEAKGKRRLEEKFAKITETWGYQEVVTPTFEYIENVTVHDGDDQKLFKFLDRQGNLMALRPDITRPIARIVASRLRNNPLPIRLYYRANVFNYEETLLGRQREFFQAGVEIIGGVGPVADAEVLALAVKALQAFELKEFRLSLGHMGIFHNVMAGLGLVEEKIQEIKAAVESKNFVALGEKLTAADISVQQQKTITGLLSLRGGKEVFVQAEKILQGEALLALENLKQVYTTLESYGVEKAVTVDLGLLRGLNYYTGVVFEGYSLSSGFPFCGGGRYDGLLGNFGYDLPATGFAFNLDQIMQAKEKQLSNQEEDAVEVLVAWEKTALDQAVNQVLALRQKGVRVEMDLVSRSEAEAAEYVQERQIKELIYVHQK